MRASPYLEDHPDFDQGVGYNEGGNGPIGTAILVELWQRIGPRVAAGDVKEAQEGRVERAEIVWRHAAENGNPHHRTCTRLKHEVRRYAEKACAEIAWAFAKQQRAYAEEDEEDHEDLADGHNGQREGRHDLPEGLEAAKDAQHA